MAQPSAAVAPASAAGAAASAAPLTPTAPSLIGPDGKLSVSAIRAQYPMYHDLTDDQLLIALHQSAYKDIPAGKFFGAVNYDTDRARLDPTNDMDTLDRLRAGAGKSLSDVIDTGKRLGNMVGVGDYDHKAAQEDQRIAQPLMNTTAGKVGKFVGDVALTAIPAAKGAQAIANGSRVVAAALPAALAARKIATGAAPFVGAAATGAATGAALSPDDLSGGAEVGAAMGPLGELGGRVAQGIYQGGKAVIEPLWDAGRQRILQRTMNRFASDPAALRAGANNPQVLVPGYTPTLAEATGDTGIAQLQRGAQIMPPVASELSAANSQRMQAYRAALDDLAGNDGKRDFFAANREGNAEQNYGKAYADGLNMTPDIQAQFDGLMQRPSIQDALPVAQRLAREKGINLDDPAGSVAGMHYVKKALDNQIGGLTNDGLSTMRDAVGDTQKDFIAALRQASPQYGNALDQYAADSRPLNQMALGQKLRDTMIPALGDFNEDLARSRAQQYAQALRDSAGTARRATGLDSATIENVLDPAQFQTVQNIGRDAARYTQAQEAGKIPGSPTAQYLGAQNVLQQTLGPLGAGPALLDSAAGRAAAGVLSLPFRATASRTEEMLARALRDPAFAAQILNARDAAPVIARAQPYAANLAVVGDKNDK